MEPALSAGVATSGVTGTDIVDALPLDFLRDLEERGCVQRGGGGVGLTIVDLTYEEWEALGLGLGLVAEASRFALGDWLVWGEGKFGDRYAQAAEITRLGHQTLLNYASTCRRVPRERRRWPNLSFSHHKEIAPLSAAEQNRWLEAALAGGWSKDRLRQEINEANGLPEPTPQPAWGAAAKERADRLAKVTKEIVAASADPPRLRAAIARAERVLEDDRLLPEKSPPDPTVKFGLRCPACGFELDA